MLKIGKNERYKFRCCFQQDKVRFDVKNNLQLIAILGMSESQFYNNKKVGEVPLGYIVEWAVKNKISMDWILYGEAKEIKKDDPLPDGFIRVPFYPDIRASAGGGCVNGECAAQNIKFITVDDSALPSSANRQHLFSVKALGDSMSENIKDGALLICDGSDKKFSNGKIFIVNSYGDTLVKRLFRSPKEEAIILRSDNPFYGEDEVPLSAVQIVAKVVRFYNGANV